jgi:hypothetical protein
MFEKRHEALLPPLKFLLRIIYSILFGLGVVFIALLIGMFGYAHYEHMSWVDAFVNAAMILSGMGPLTPLYTKAGKIFAGSYALFSGLSFILIIGIIFSPIIHRFFHHFHIETDDDKK